MACLHLRVTGKVQGVFYRKFVNEKAKELGLAGFVRNEPDGSVYLEIEGDREIIPTCLEKLKKGPFLAKVASVEILKEHDSCGYKNFKVK